MELPSNVWLKLTLPRKSFNTKKLEKVRRDEHIIMLHNEINVSNIIQ